eukprot:NODE_222_length_13951_cov_0.396982.p3 type:complete len:465 gc:universal NODE_222_length_13951_cov_0.396982:8227-9621(+)
MREQTRWLRWVLFYIALNKMLLIFFLIMERVFLNSKLLISKPQLSKVLSVHSQENIMDFIDLYYDLGGSPGQLEDALIDRIISHEANDFKVVDLYKTCKFNMNATERVRCFKAHFQRMKVLVHDQGFHIQSIRSLLTNAGKEVLLCGILFHGHGEEPYMEDDSGQVHLVLSPDKVGIGMYFESNILIVKGKYIKEGKLFKVSSIMHPPILEDLSRVKEREVISKKMERGYCLFFHQMYVDVKSVQDDFVFTLKRYLDRNITILCITISDCFQASNPQDQRTSMIHFVRRIGTELSMLLREVEFVFLPPPLDIIPTARYMDYVFQPVLNSFEHLHLVSNPCLIDCYGRSIAVFPKDYSKYESIVPHRPDISKSYHIAFTIASQMRLTCFKHRNLLYSDELFFKQLPSLIVCSSQNEWFEHNFKSRNSNIDDVIVNNNSSYAERRTWTAYLPYSHKLEYCKLPKKK